MVVYDSFYSLLSFWSDSLIPVLFDFFSEEEIIVDYMAAFDTKYFFVIWKIASAVWALFHNLSGYVFNLYPASPFSYIFIQNYLLANVMSIAIVRASHSCKSESVYRLIIQRLMLFHNI